MSAFRPCIVIPCYNHGATLPAVLAALAPRGLPIIVVDDASEPPVEIDETGAPQSNDTDNLLRRGGRGEAALPSNTTSPLPTPSPLLLRHTVNQGKGGAVVTGLREAARLGFTHALQIDADGQHDTGAVGPLLDLARAHPGALISGRPRYDASVPRARRYGRLITHAWVWLETLSFQIKDSLCGLRVYPLAPTLALLDRCRLGRRMDFDVEIMVRLFWENVPVRFLPVRVTYPAGGVSHFHPLRDNLRISWMHTRLVCGLLPRLPRLLYRRLARHNTAALDTPPSPIAHRLSPSSHWSRLAERRGLWGMRFLFFTYRVLGRGVFQFLLRPVVAVFWVTARCQRLASRDYLRRLRARAAALGVPLPARLTSYRHFLRFGESLLDKLAAWHGDIPRASVRVTDNPDVTRLFATKKGGLVLCPHIGNFEVFRALTTFSGQVINAIFYTRHAGRFNRLLREISPDSQLRLISIADFGPATAVSLQEKINAGEWVAMGADRTAPDNRKRAVRVRFLGADALLPQGPFLLAAALGCPVFILVVLDEPGGRTVHVETFAERLDMPRADRAAALSREAQRFADRLEHYCLRAPLDWFNFYDFWKNDPDAPHR